MHSQLGTGPSGQFFVQCLSHSAAILSAACTVVTQRCAASVMAAVPPVTAAQAKIFIGTGAHGVNKLFVLPASSSSGQLPSAGPTAEPLLPRPNSGVVAFFVGDQVEDARQPPRVRELQDPRVQAALADDAFPGAAVAVVMPSRLEGGCACFDHFLHRTTATGEPLGYRYALAYRCRAKLSSSRSIVAMCYIQSE